MDENLDGKLRIANCELRINRRRLIRRSKFDVRHLADFLDGTFARQHSEVAAEVTGEFHARRARDGHLRGGMDRKIRRELPDEAADAHVLHDGRVHAGGDDGAQIIFRIGQFVLKNQRIERDVTFDAAPVQKSHELRQVGLGEIVRPHPRVEFIQAEVDGIRAIFNGGLGAFPIAGGREQFRQARQAAFLFCAFAGSGCGGRNHFIPRFIAVCVWQNTPKRAQRPCR